MLVDSHCHVAPYWYEDLDVLLFQMDRNGVERAVLIQMMAQANNDYQAECVRRYPDRFASVVIVDTNRADAPAALARLAEQGAGGVRLRPETRSPGDDPLAIWRAAAKLRLPVSCCGRTAEFLAPGFSALVEALPELPIVVEHLGGANHPDNDPVPLETRRAVFGLARFPNLYVKIHGLGEFARRAMPVVEPFPFEQPIPPLLELAYDAFGPARMMWGSDYPPVSGREGYRLALRLTMDQLAGKPQEARDLIFGGVANSVFKVPGA